MKAGIYRDMSFRDYLALPYPSASSIKIGSSVSLKHMRAAVDRKLADKDTRDRRFGRAFHCWLLERERFNREYHIQKHCTGMIGSGKNKGKSCSNWGTAVTDDGKWLCGVHAKGLGLKPVENMVTGEDLTQIQGAGKSLEGRDITNVLKTVGCSELTVIAEVEGVLVKSRFDFYALTSPMPTIIDVKKITVMRGSEESLQKTIREIQYDLQASLYKRIHLEAFGKPAAFLWLFVEDSFPFEVIPRYLSPRGELVGSAKALPTLRRWAECVEWNRYPGYCDEATPIEPAEWELKKYGVNNFEVT